MTVSTRAKAGASAAAVQGDAASRMDAPSPAKAAVTFEAVAARLGILPAVIAGRLTPQTRLAVLAVDSLEMVEIVIDLQEEFGVNLTQADLRDARTLGDLVALLQRGSPGAPQD